MTSFAANAASSLVSSARDAALATTLSAADAASATTSFADDNTLATTSSAADAASPTTSSADADASTGISFAADAASATTSSAATPPRQTTTTMTISTTRRTTATTQLNLSASSPLKSKINIWRYLISPHVQLKMPQATALHPRLGQHVLELASPQSARKSSCCVGRSSRNHVQGSSLFLTNII